MIRWFLNLLDTPRPAVFESAYGLEESVHRLAATTRGFASWTRQYADGTVTARHVSLRRVIPPFVGGYSYAPYFRGSFRQVGDKVQLIGSFAMHPVAKASLIFNICFCMVFTIFSLSAIGSHGWWMPLIGVSMLVMFLGILRLSKWFARNDISWLSQVIEEALSQ